MFEKLSNDDVERIGILLSKRHPELNPLETGLNDLHRYVIELLELEGDPKTFGEEKLEAIRAAWNTEFLDRTVPG